MSEIIASDKKHVWHHLTQHSVFDSSDPMIIESGEGMRVTDINGKTFLDATSGGVWSVNVGYGRTEIADAVRDQLLKMCYFANSAGNVPAAEYAAALIDKMPGMSRVYFSNSGSEANEKAYKMVRQLAHINGNGEKYKIIYRDRDYHGTTIGALSSTGQAERREQYGPFVPGFSSFSHCCCYRCPFGKTYGECNIECAQDLERAILEEGPETVGSVVLEPITAGGGVIPPVPEYFPIIQEICKKYDVLLHIDEVVCGLGRTGTWFGYQNYDVKPDFVTMAKGVASGYAAISCTVTTEAVFEKFKAPASERMPYFRDISTFGGCTAGPTAGLKTLEILEREELLSNVKKMGTYLMEGLHHLKNRFPVIGDVRGKGLFAGIELVTDRESKTPAPESYAVQIAGACAKNGLLIGRTNRSFDLFNNTLCLSPALIATKGDIEEIVSIIERSFEATPLQN
ncbi:aminotransferase class III-fold pyridoxal phosphate-dependent enzyme [Spongiibacter sp. KMU-158]|uniref:Aminotransferase class III-fold pyridoxal phosphate-dependent enzyme n=2 Tax=Spongiibacter pelagi TaxID=2760804 RepID=A0A927BYK0_9GAMM|nr:aminotransferase class III-fold pyridoxal phosphate-dependent enzyme [Spongiibacter pelagi]